MTKPTKRNKTKKEKAKEGNKKLKSTKYIANTNRPIITSNEFPNYNSIKQPMMWIIMIE